MKRSHRIAIGAGIAALLAYAVWEALQPGPPQPGDQRWCQAIRDKPLSDWTADDARGFAEQTCMRWDLKPPGETN
ncbi:MAG: DUF3012 domain-containing protein [Pseudomonadota bacterium]|nr:DUF3012 domain-containing protein [Pseudomonadota bacterium]